ncbi:peptide ABC transporter substrate-binding protein [Carnobacterium gallinarum]|uniref:peptide ABC transporter substrate-binding protein n=1 Tax=Carnobacterium gallinarum TaxID=2749 RepID=UPI0005573133|nr:peptide ABC transporter substrate-binding protein [Carnobacterium gallinarum]
MKKLVKVAFLSILSLAVLTACGGANSAESSSSSSENKGHGKNEQVLNLSIAAELPTVDPALVQDGISFTALNQVMEGLYRLDKKGNPIPALADGEATVSSDGLTYTFKLKPDLVWSNKAELTAADFEYGWKRVVNPKTAANYAFVMKDIKNAQAIMDGTATVDTLGIKAIDKLTLEVTLEKPVENFLASITRGTFFPQNEAFVTKEGEKFGTNSERAIYNGPFVLTDWDGTGLSWNYEKNPNYWDEKNVALTKVTNQVIKETSTGINLYQDDTIDLVRLTGEYAKQFIDDPEFKAPTEARSVYLELDHVNHPALKNEKLREAIALTINRKDLVTEIIANGSTALGGLVTKDLAKNSETGEDFRKASGSYLDYDLKKAKTLWSEAKKELGIEKTEIELVTDDDETSKKVSQFIQSSIEEELDGVKIKIKNVPFKNRIELGDTGQFGLLLSGWGADANDPDAFLNLFLSGSVFNGGKYTNAKYDALIQAATGTDSGDPAKKWQNDLAAEKILMDDVGIIPLYQKADSILVKSHVKDYIQYQIGSPNLKYVSLTGE